MYPISTTTLTNATTQFISFSSIPQNFTHLQIRVYARATVSSATDYCALLIGSSDTGHSLLGNGSSASSSYATSSFGYGMISIPAASATSGIFGSMIIDILDYSNANKANVAKAIGGYDANGSGEVRLSSMFDTAGAYALTGFNIFTGSTFAVGTRIDLYGITTA